MNENLKKIKILSEELTNAISEYLSITEKVRIIIPKVEFKNIRHIGKINSYRHVFKFDTNIYFELPDSGDSYGYEVMHYRKLLSGELEQLILIKLETPSNFNNYTINYQLEPLVKTKLYDLYPDSETV